MRVTGSEKNAPLTDLPVDAPYKIAKRLMPRAPMRRHFHPLPPLAGDYRRGIALEEIGKPVITSSVACFWRALKLIDIKETVSGYGRLMVSLGN